MSSKAEGISPEDRIEILKRYGQITPPVKKHPVKRSLIGVKSKPPDKPPAGPVPSPPPQDTTKQSASFKSPATGPEEVTPQEIPLSYHPNIPPVEVPGNRSIASKVSHKFHLSDTDKQAFETAKEKRKGGKTLFDNTLIDSEALKALWPPAVKVLLWFQQKLVRRKDNRDKKWRVIDIPLSFTYQEANWRGLSRQRFRKCLKELHAKGFIDVDHPGSNLRGDYTTFKISDRWRDFGTSAFKDIDYPKSVSWTNFGYGSQIVKPCLKKGKKHLIPGKIK